MNVRATNTRPKVANAVTIAIRRDISFSFALVSNVVKACDGSVEKNKHFLL
jgi:hypothetical protein